MFHWQLYMSLTLLSTLLWLLVSYNAVFPHLIASLPLFFCGWMEFYWVHVCAYSCRSVRGCLWKGRTSNMWCNYLRKDNRSETALRRNSLEGTTSENQPESMFLLWKDHPWQSLPFGKNTLKRKWNNVGKEPHEYWSESFIAFNGLHHQFMENMFVSVFCLPI